MGSSAESVAAHAYGNTTVFSGPVDVTSSIPYQNIAGQTIIVTGGASGLGAGFATEWAIHGANIIVGDLNEQAGTKLVAELRTTSNNPNHHFIPLDVTSWPSQVSFFKKAASLSPHGGIDCVIANAGICDAIETMKFEDPPNYQEVDDPAPPSLKTLQVNMTGVMYTTNLALSYLSRNPGSVKCSLPPSPGPRDRHLILVSSIAGITALPSQSLYSTSKHAVAGLWRSLRVNAPIKTGIRVNMINPYFVDTPIMGPIGGIIMAGGALGQVKDVVEAATRFVSDKGIVGRALLIGPKAYPQQIEAVGMDPTPAVGKGQTIWEFFGDDYAQTDLFIRRIIRLTNVMAGLRGWKGIVSDILAKILGSAKQQPK